MKYIRFAKVIIKETQYVIAFCFGLATLCLLPQAIITLIIPHHAISTFEFFSIIAKAALPCFTFFVASITFDVSKSIIRLRDLIHFNKYAIDLKPIFANSNQPLLSITNEITEWCKTCCSSSFKIVKVKRSYLLLISSKEDIVTFKLAWG
jgi:hypothetical protein